MDRREKEEGDGDEKKLETSDGGLTIVSCGGIYHYSVITR